MLQTSRLTLRHASHDDSDFILSLLNDPSWLRYIGDRGVKTLDDAHSFIDKKLHAMHQEYGFGMLVAERKSDGVAMGLCGLIRRDGLEHPDLGFGFLPEFCGKGYAAESARSIMRWAHTEHKLDRLLAITLQDNTASIKLLELLGFEFLNLTTIPSDPKKLRLYEADLTHL